MKISIQTYEMLLTKLTTYNMRETDDRCPHKNKNHICTKHMDCLNTASSIMKYAEFTIRLDWKVLIYIHSLAADVNMLLYIFNS
jgi:hypothetical protein